MYDMSMLSHQFSNEWWGGGGGGGEGMNHLPLLFCVYIVEEFSAERQRAIISWDHYLTT